MKAINDQVIIDPEDTSIDVTKGGIFVPESVSHKQIYKGKVVSIGPGRYSKKGGGFVPTSVKVGDTITYRKFDGVFTFIDDHEYLIMREDSILGVL